MKKLIYFLFPILLVQSACAQSNFSFFYAMKNLDEEEIKFLDNNNFQVANIIYQKFIDPEDNVILNKELLRNTIINEFPEGPTKVLGVLNWEGKAFKQLADKNISKKEKKQIIQEFIKAIRIAKSTRPDIKWGFYGIPFREYWHRNDEWIENSKIFLTLLKECDYIAPSLYKLYSDSLENRLLTKGFVKDNIYLALQIGRELNKPVYPFIWQRLHDGNKNEGLKLIPKNEFENYLMQIKGVQYQGTKVSGVIWWSHDKTILKDKKSLLRLRSYRREENLDNNSFDIIKTYTKIIKATLDD